MVVYDKIVEDIYEPRNKNVLWLKPVKGGFSFYRYKNDNWEAFKIVDDKGTSDTDDDTEVDLNNIPTMDNIEEKIQEEVTTQIADHDENVRDTHNTDSPDSDEYPDVDNLFG